MSTYPQIIDMSVADSAIDGLKIITLKQVTDERGTVREYYRQSSWLAAGLPDLGPFLQLNLTETRRGGVRGMHAEDMVKVVTVAGGSAFGAYVDLRTDSPTAGKVVTVALRPGITPFRVQIPGLKEPGAHRFSATFEGDSSTAAKVDTR